MVAPGVPGQLRDETVVLVPVVVMVGEDEVRREARLEVLEGFLEELALERKKSVAKPMNDDIASVLVPARKTSAERRASSTLSGSSPANTTHFTSSCGLDLGQLQNRTAGPNFNVVAMGAKTKQTLHTSSNPEPIASSPALSCWPKPNTIRALACAGAARNLVGFA